MTKSTHFAVAGACFAICSAGFIMAHYLVLGAGVGAVAAVYGALAFRAQKQERRHR